MFADNGSTGNVRWTLTVTPDPLGFAAGDTNLTRYVGNAPNDYTDPTGTSWLSKAFRKVKREVSRVVSQIREGVKVVWEDVRDFAKEHPVIAGLAALATGTWFVSAAGGLAGAAAKIGAGSKTSWGVSTSSQPPRASEAPHRSRSATSHRSAPARPPNSPCRPSASGFRWDLGDGGTAIGDYPTRFSLAPNCCRIADGV